MKLHGFVDCSATTSDSRMRIKTEDEFGITNYSVIPGIISRLLKGCNEG